MQKSEGIMTKVVFKVGGEPVAVILAKDEREVKQVKLMLKSVYPDEKITTKEVGQ